MEKKFKIIDELEKESYFKEKCPIGIDYESTTLSCSHCGEPILPKNYKIELQCIQYNPPTVSDREYDRATKEVQEHIDERLRMYNEHYTTEPHEFIVCPNAPECDGTVIDWIPTESQERWDKLQEDMNL